MRIRHFIKTNNKEQFEKICSILKEAGVEYEIDNNLIIFISDKPIQAISTRFYFIE